MRSLSRLAVAAGLTLLVSLALPLAIVAVLALRDSTAEPPVRVATRPPAEALADEATVGATQAPCRVTLLPGDDISAAIAAQPIDAVVCLARGIHRPFSVTRSVSAGVVVRGEGEGETVVQAQRADGVTVTDVERFTLADMTVRGGTPAGIYAARTRGLSVRGVSVQSAGFGIHADDGAAVTLEDVTLTGSSDFGLLVRRRAAVSGERVRVLESRQIGVGATEAAASLTLRESEIGTADLPSPADGVVLLDVAEVMLDRVTVHGGNPAGIYAARVPRLHLRDVRVEGATYGMHVDDGSVASLEDVRIAGSTGVGLLLRRGAVVSGDRVRVVDAVGTGVAAVNDAASLTLRDGEVGPVAGAGVFAGMSGCAELAPASLAVPDCFLADLDGFIAGTAVRLERMSVHDTVGTGIVFFPGVQAEVVDSTVLRCELTGLFAWGATVDVRGSLFDDNAEHALEYRAYPDPRGEVLLAAAGTVATTTVQGTRPLPSGALGGGVLAQGAELSVTGSVVQSNADIGVSYQNGGGGAVTGGRIVNNAGIGLCIAATSAVTVQGVTIAGNQVNRVNGCGG